METVLIVQTSLIKQQYYYPIFNQLVYAVIFQNSHPVMACSFIIRFTKQSKSLAKHILQFLDLSYCCQILLVLLFLFEKKKLKRARLEL